MLSKIEKNKFTLISGATSDIGCSIANKLKDNHNLIIAGRNYSQLKSLSSKLNSQNQVKLWEHDLSHLDGINDSLDNLLKENLISIDNFIHVAGVTKILPIRMFSIENYNNIFNVNFFSAVEIIKCLMMKNNRKHLNNILLISALFSKFGDKGNSMYASSKGAIDSFVKSLAVEIAPIKVNSILPGAINTKMTSELFDSEDYKKYFQSKYLLGMGSAQHISNYINYLIQEDTWITGQNIIIDGGASCH
jgi:short-subunit dehydrogenase